VAWFSPDLDLVVAGPHFQNRG